MIEAVKRRLRGDYNSIRTRYFEMPRRWIDYLLRYRLFGKSWVKYYADLIDTDERAKGHVNPEYVNYGKVHFDYLRSQGLKKGHSLLDYGCGRMRAGLHFAKFLGPGRYVGVDISEERLKNGRELMRAAGIGDDEYESICVRDCYLRELDGRKFDFVWAASVLTHMPENDIRAALSSIRRLLAPDGAFYFTYAEADQEKRRIMKDFWYPRAKIAELCEEAGLSFELMPHYREWGDVMARAVPRNGTVTGETSQHG